MAVITVSGANGFIGRELVERLSHAHEVRCVIRHTDRAISAWQGRFRIDVVGAIGARTDWSGVLKGTDVIIHLAAAAHQASVNHSVVRDVNVDGVRQLAKEAIANDVRRIVLISSIGVNGNVTYDEPFDELSPIRPHDAYSYSKSQAEEVLQSVAEKSSLEFVIVRPPLVYGPGAPGNFGRLVDLIRRGVPLPFAGIRNQRSLISRSNLCDFLCQVSVSSRAADNIFVVSDDEDVSTCNLIRYLASSMNVTARLINVPLPLLNFGSTIVGRRADFERLCGSLQVRPRKALDLLDWKPPVPLVCGLDAAVAQE